MGWHWQAHGFNYGIDTRYAADVTAGKIVVVNGSREHCSPLQGQAHIRVMQISTDAKKLAQRLAQRGRDSELAVRLRLVRNAKFADWQANHTIHNQAEFAVVGIALVDYLLNIAKVYAAACDSHASIRGVFGTDSGLHLPARPGSMSCSEF